MKVLILGGAKSGKSDFAQEITLRLTGEGKRYYVATMIPADKEDDARIQSHIERRAGMEFETVEQGRNLMECLDRVDRNSAVLLDSVTSLLTNELFPKEKNYELDEEAACRMGKEVEQFLDSVDNAVVVADNLFFDAVHYDRETDVFRRHLGSICCALAGRCDTVLEMTCGNLIIHKGELPQ